MSKVQPGDTVVIDYVVRKGDGMVVADTKEQGAQTITLGEGAIFPQIEEKLTEMEVGDDQTVDIACEQAFGPRNDEMVIDIPRENLPPEMDPQPGMTLQAQQQDGATVTLFIVAVGEQSVKADGNHPLAGEDLAFDVTLREVRKAA